MNMEPTVRIIQGAPRMHIQTPARKAPILGLRNVTIDVVDSTEASLARGLNGIVRLLRKARPARIAAKAKQRKIRKERERIAFATIAMQGEFGGLTAIVDGDAKVQTHSAEVLAQNLGIIKAQKAIEYTRVKAED